MFTPYGLGDLVANKDSGFLVPIRGGGASMSAELNLRASSLEFHDLINWIGTDIYIKKRVLKSDWSQ